LWATLNEIVSVPVTLTGSPIYAVMLLCGIAWGAVYWFRESKKDARVLLIYGAGLAGAFAGAKLAFLLSEGWLHFYDPLRWMVWLSGKSIMGALPGGWIGVEIAKKVLGYHETTGDRFAMLLPLPLFLGRIGCRSAGCCGGIECSFGSWPSVEVEMGFQVVAFMGLWLMRRKQWQMGQHFHLYLIAYGLFRFAHEFMRITPKPFFGLSGYQLLGLATFTAALIAYRLRKSRTSGRC
jgi:phosphatidylglycerol---prolipoprotein diacylglyceryl transferase